MRISEVESRISAAEAAIKFADGKLAELPAECLVVRHRRGKALYYSKADGTEVYLRPGEVLIAKLQMKEYCKRLKAAALYELNCWSKVRGILDRISYFDSVYDLLPEELKSGIEPYVSAEDERVRRMIEREYKYWQEEAYSKKGVDKSINLVSLNGERVRSKSEVIIADRLHNAGVLYRYEGKLVLENEYSEFSVWHPDFEILNMRTGEKFYWEHLGIMDDTRYCESAIAKIEIYAKHGIIPGKNLIITMECSSHPLNTRYVDALIKEFLV